MTAVLCVKLGPAMTKSTSTCMHTHTVTRFRIKWGPAVSCLQVGRSDVIVIRRVQTAEAPT